MILDLPKPHSRQAQVLDLMLQGKSSKQIAAALGISKGAVDEHRQNLMRRMGVNNSYEAMHLIHTAQIATLKAEISDLVKFIFEKIGTGPSAIQPEREQS